VKTLEAANMDEYNLANVFLDHSEIQEKVVDLNGFQKIPFAELAGLGGIIAELIPQFRTVTETTSIPMDGLFRAINPKTGEVMPDLMYRSKQVADAFVGSLKHANGEFDQAAFVKVPGVKEVTTSVAAINPATLMIAAGIMAMSKKLDAIEENQKKIMGFLEKDKESKLRGNLIFLMSVFSAYKTNWNNSTFKTSQHIKTQDIKQESEQNIVFYRSMLSDLLKKKKILISKLDVKKNMQKLIENFSNYRLAIYLYAFASYLEIILLENYNEEFLESISSKIKDESFSYSELYTIAYTKLEGMATESIESGVIKGVAIVSHGLGKVIEKIPVVERGQLDENLIAASKKLEEYKVESVDDLLTALRTMSNCQVKQFVDLIETVNELHNGEPAILVDNENVYVQLAC
jgi:hypothetical protein